MIGHDYRIKYRVFYRLSLERERNPNKYYSIREIAKLLGEDSSSFWTTRNVRNAVIELISERMVDNDIRNDKNEHWRLVIRARKLTEEMPEVKTKTLGKLC